MPFVIVTGFLGSGKTTLLNRVLARRAARGASGKLGVIVNELGAVGIDGALLGGRGGDQPARQIELPGGCVCCVLGDDLERTLLELVDANPELEAIVLETTGAAEPLPIAWAAQRGAAGERVRLAAVVTLVDATNFRAARAVSPAVDAQVAYADVLLLTKAALAGAEETARVEAEVRTLASRALVRRASTDEHAAWLEEVLVDPSLERPASLDGEADHAHRHAHGHVHTDECDDNECRQSEHAAHGIDSVWVAVPGVVDLEELEDQLTELPANYVRIKGIVRATDGRVAGGAPTRWVAIHRVGLRVSSEPFDAPDLEQARIVALGPAVKSDVLGACVDAATKQP